MLLLHTLRVKNGSPEMFRIVLIDRKWSKSNGLKFSKKTHLIKNANKDTRRKNEASARDNRIMKEK